MFGWIIAWCISYLFNAGWYFVISLGLAVFFPKLTQFLFASVVFPVYTLFFGTWAFVISWLSGWVDFTWDA